MMASSSLPDLPPNYLKALELIDEAHKQDPRPSSVESVPFELHYAQKMTRWLAVRSPAAPPVLQLACRAQHFRRWEIPRNTYPMTRPGYLTWRAKLKSQAAAQVAELLASSPDIQPAIPQEDVDRVAALIRKENLSKDEETQVLEDVACLVFLDDHFDDFESKEEVDEDKIIGILRKTWAKMSEEGHALALKMNHSERALSLIGKALAGDDELYIRASLASEKILPWALGVQSTPACMGGSRHTWAIARVASKGKPGEDGTLQPHHPEGPSRRNTARNRLPPSVPGHVRLRLGARPATTYKDGDARLHLPTSSLSLTPFFYPSHLCSYDKNMPPLTLTPTEVSKHDRLDDLWLAIDGAVYDLTDFVREHPGGIAVILKCAGKDATGVYSEVHGPNLVKSTIPSSHHKGVLPPGAIMAKPQPHKWSQQQQQDPSQKQDSQTPPTPPTMPSKPPLTTLISAHDFESAASTSFSPKAWAFVSSAATDLFTKTRNAALYSQITLRPRVLVDVAAVSTATTMLSHPMRAPIFCPPTAMARLVHPEGEKELGRACKSAGVPQCVSVSASFPLEDILAAQREHEPATPYDVPVFFQLYVDKNRANSERLLRSAQAQGVKALFLTIDAPIPGKREADERVASDESLGSPISGARAVNDAKGGALGRIMGSYIDASVNWSDIAWLRRTVPGLPIVLKGVQTWMDAERAVEAGVEAIVLSNHGGRSLDTSPATIMVLLELQKNCPHVFDRVEVYVDGGISRGTDIFKALCLGAKAVGVGRGLLYGLNYGAEGVERYIEILRDELETTMKMCGVTNLNQVHPGFLNTLAVDHLIPGRHDNPNTPWRRDLHSKL